MNCTSFLRTIVCFFGLGAFAAQAEPLQIVRGVHPVLTVTIDGKRKARMLIDTGAAQTFLAKDFARKGNLADICLTKGVCFKDVNVFTGSNTYNQSADGYYNGLIGWDILSKLVTTIDYQAGTVDFQSKGAGTKLHFTLDKTGRPQASITISGIAMGNQLLDTGGSYVRITKSQRVKLGKTFVPDGNEVSFTVKGPEKTTMSVPVEICIANACGPSILQEAVWPAVGGSFFRNFRVTIDGPGQAFWLQPVKAPTLKTTVSRYGFQLSATDATTLLFVSDNSPAALAGLTVKDRLIAINGKSIADIGYFGAIDLLEQDNKAGIVLDLLSTDTLKTIRIGG